MSVPVIILNDGSKDINLMNIREIWGMNRSFFVGLPRGCTGIKELLLIYAFFLERKIDLLGEISSERYFCPQIKRWETYKEGS